jgi:DNA-binding beta-propeller fold protein YncE
LQGKVSRGPITPTCRIGNPCSAPARGLTLRFSKDGNQAVVAQTKTGKDGAYRIDLPPGIYFVMAAQPVKPQHVTVPKGRYARVDFSFDTKIR